MEQIINFQNTQFNTVLMSTSTTPTKRFQTTTAYIVSCGSSYENYTFTSGKNGRFGSIYVIWRYELRTFQRNGLKLDKDFIFSGLVQNVYVYRMAKSKKI